MSYSLDFSGLSNVNPFVFPPELTASGAFKIENARLKSNSGERYFRHNGTEYQRAAGKVVSAKVAVYGTQATYNDGCGPAVIDANGDGYVAYVTGPQVAIHVINAGVRNTVAISGNISTSLTYNTGDEFELEFDVVAGTLRLFNTPSGGSRTLLGYRTDTTHTSKNLTSAAYALYDNTNAKGIVAFGADIRSVIGYDSPNLAGMSNTPRTSADPHFLMNVDGVYTPTNNEEVFEVGFHAGTGTPAQVEVGVFRLDTMAKVASGVISSAVASTRNVVAVSGIMAAGVAHGIGWRTITSGNLLLTTTGVVTSGTRNTNLTGANPLPSTFTDTGPALSSRWAVFASSREIVSLAPHGRTTVIDIPPGAPTGSQTLLVTYSDGSTASATIQVNAPASTVNITSVDIDNALTQGQLAVSIAGTGFGASQGGSTVEVNSVAYTPVSWSDTEVVINLPPSLITTTFDIVITVGGDFDAQSVTLAVTHPYVAPQGTVDSNSICPSPITWPSGTYLSLPALPTNLSFKSPYTSWADVVAANLLANDVSDYLESTVTDSYVFTVGVLAPNTAPDTYNITVTVSEPVTAPVLNSAIPDVTTKEQGGTVNLDITSYFTGTVDSYAVSGLPASTGLSFNTSTGVLSGTVAAADIAASPYNLTFTATNTGGSANDTISLTVDRVPTLTLSAGTISTKEGTPASITVTTSDAADGTTPIVITNLGSLHSGHGVSLTGNTLTVSGTAEDGTAGSFTINLSTTDSAGNVVTDSVSVTVIGFPLTAPIGTVSGRSLFQGATYPSGTKFRFVTMPTHFSFTNPLNSTDWSASFPTLGTWDGNPTDEIFSVELKTPANQYGTFSVTLDPNDPELRTYVYEPGDNLVYSLAESQFYRIDNQTKVSSVNTKTGHVTITLSELGGSPLNHTHAVATGTTAGFMSATDKAKLDGISAGATSDPTALLTAIKTVDGAASGLDADLLDGQDSTYYRNASNINAGTLAAARLPAASTSAVGAVQLSSSTASTSEALAATAYAVKLAYDVGNHAHPYLGVSDTAVNSLALNGQASTFYTNASNLSTGTIPAARLPAASTVAVGGVQLYDGIDSTSATLAATANAVRLAYNVGNHAHPYLSTTGKAADSSLLNGKANNTGIIGNTIAERDASGDIQARLFRSNYAAQTTAAGAGAAVAFRNDITDNYIRFMDKTSFESWLSLAYANKTTTGFIRATGSVIGGYSDDRLKVRFGKVRGALDDVLGWDVFRYLPSETAISLGAHNTLDFEIGLSAQQVGAAYGELTTLAPLDINDETGESKTGENYMTIKYDRVVAVLVAAIQELNTKVDHLTPKTFVGKLIFSAFRFFEGHR